MLGGITAFTTGSEYRNSYPIQDNHALNFSYLCNYQYCTTLIIFMCLHMNIYWEMDLDLKTSLGASLTSSGCLWRGYFTNTQATNQRDMTCFYIIRQHGEENKWNGVCELYYSGWQVNMWVMVCLSQMRFVASYVKCLKRKGSFHAIESLIGSPKEVRLETYKSTSVCRR